VSRESRQSSCALENLLGKPTVFFLAFLSALELAFFLEEIFQLADFFFRSLRSSVGARTARKIYVSSLCRFHWRSGASYFWGSVVMS